MIKLLYNGRQISILSLAMATVIEGQRKTQHVGF